MMRKLGRALLLVLTLSVVANAGEIQYGVASAGQIPCGSGGEIPNNAQASGNIPFGVAGDMPFDRSVEGHIPCGGGACGEQAVELVLNLLQPVLSMF